MDYDEGVLGLSQHQLLDCTLSLSAILHEESIRVKESDNAAQTRLKSASLLLDRLVKASAFSNQSASFACDGGQYVDASVIASESNNATSLLTPPRSTFTSRHPSPVSNSPLHVTPSPRLFIRLPARKPLDLSSSSPGRHPSSTPDASPPRLYIRLPARKVLGASPSSSSEDSPLSNGVTVPPLQARDVFDDDSVLDFPSPAAPSVDDPMDLDDFAADSDDGEGEDEDDGDYEDENDSEDGAVANQPALRRNLPGGNRQNGRAALALVPEKECKRNADKPAKGKGKALHNIQGGGMISIQPIRNDQHAFSIISAGANHPEVNQRLETLVHCLRGTGGKQVLVDGDIISTISTLQKLEQMGSVVDFLSIVNHLQLYLLVERMCRFEGYTCVNDIWRRLDLKRLQVANNTLYTHRTIGGKIAAFVSGCGVYGLVLLAIIPHLFSFVKHQSSTVDVISAVGLHLRHPEKDSIYERCIKDSIIPCLEKIRRCLNLQIATRHDGRSFGSLPLPSWISTVDMSGSDIFIERMLKTPMPCQRSCIWDNFRLSCLENGHVEHISIQPLTHAILSLGGKVTMELAPSPDVLAPPPNISEHHEDHHDSHTITMKVKAHQKCPYKKKAVKEWTAQERQKCEKDISDPARSPNSIEDLRGQCENLFKKGKRVQGYLQVKPNLYDKQVIKFVDGKDKLLLAVDGTVDSTLGKSTSDWLKLLNMKGASERTTEDAGTPGQSSHFSRWNRCGKKVKLKPGQTIYELEDPVTKARPVQKTMSPYAAEELHENPDQYDEILYTLHPVLCTMEDKLREALPPDAQKELDLIIRILPMGDAGPVSPFTGFVVNMGLSTNAHRDTMDLSYCVVIPFGTWQGGQLCIHEMGLVLDLAPGTIVIFRSDILTHFNLEHTGVRFAFVMSTDKHMKSWAKNSLATV